MENIGALILAAAAGSGFGGAVALARWRDKTVLDHLIAVAGEAGITDVAVVLGPAADDVIASTRTEDVTFVVDYDWTEGESSWLRAGLDTMWRDSQLEEAVIIDVTRPGIESDVVGRLLDAHRPAVRPVTLPKYRYARGGPILIDRSLWPRLMGLEGSVDLVTLLEAHSDWVNEVWIDRVPPARVDSPSDIETLLGGW